jgi:hypothetical protein
MVRQMAASERSTHYFVAPQVVEDSGHVLAGRCSSWRNISGKKWDRAGSSSVRRSGRTISPPWPALHGHREDLLFAFLLLSTQELDAFFVWIGAIAD